MARHGIGWDARAKRGATSTARSRGIATRLCCSPSSRKRKSTSTQPSQAADCSFYRRQTKNCTKEAREPRNRLSLNGTGFVLADAQFFGGLFYSFGVDFAVPAQFVQCRQRDELGVHFEEVAQRGA